MTPPREGRCGPLEAVIRTIWFFGCIIGGACILYFGPGYPRNAVSGGVAMFIILAAAFAFLPIERKPKTPR